MTPPLPSDTESNDGRQAIKGIWSQANDRLVRETWPRPRALTLLQALGDFDPAKKEDLEREWAALEHLLEFPIVALAGTINGGKSSLAASFLGPAGAERVLRGVDKQSGTQRFVLWLPESWKGRAAEFSRLCAWLEQTFGAAPELLAEDPETARRQQNAGEKLQVPLVGLDGRLDRLRLAILDCPDIQREDSAGARTREEMLRRAAGLCSALILVIDRSQLEIKTVAELTRLLPGVRRFFAINKVRQESLAELAREVREGLGLGAGDMVYAAYDFAIRGFERLTPAWDPNLKMLAKEPEGSGKLVPCFIPLAEGEPREEESLLHVFSRLAPEDFQREGLIARQSEFLAKLRLAADSVEKRCRGDAERLETAAKELEERLTEALRSDGAPEDFVVALTPEVRRSFRESLERTAGLLDRVTLLPVAKALAKGRDLAARALFLDVRAGDLRDGLAKMVHGLESRRFARILSDWSAQGGRAYRSLEDWEPIARAALVRFGNEDHSNLEAAEWDAHTRKLWEKLGRKERVILLGSAVLMMGGAALAFVDGGVTLTVISGADLAGGAAFLGGSGIAGLAGLRLNAEIGRRLGELQSANIVALFHDELGLPRPSTADSTPLASVPVRAPSEEGYAQRELSWKMRAPVEPAWSRFLQELTRTIPQRRERG